MERVRAQLRIAERVGNPLRGDEVLVVTGVADERPPGTERLAAEIRDGGADEALFTPRSADVGALGLVS